jgi:hypothetical protein
MIRRQYQHTAVGVVYAIVGTAVATLQKTVKERAYVVTSQFHSPLRLCYIIVDQLKRYM